jgi:hypothetical protein
MLGREAQTPFDAAKGTRDMVDKISKHHRSKTTSNRAFTTSIEWAHARHYWT